MRRIVILFVSSGVMQNYFDIEFESDLWCILGSWMDQLLGFSASYILCLFTLDRLMASRRPMMYREKLSNKLTYPIKCTVATYFLMAFLVSPTSMIFTMGQGTCVTRSDISPWLKMLYFYYSVVLLYCIIPSVALLIMNILIIRSLR